MNLLHWQEKQLNIIQEQDSTVRRSEHKGEAGVPYSTTQTKMDCIKRIKEAATH